MSEKTKKLIFFAIVGLVLWQVLAGGKLPIGPVNPPVIAAPFKADKLCILIVRESANDAKLPAWVKATAAGSVRDTVNKVGGEMLLLDKDQSDFSNYDPWLKEAFAVPHPDLPWIVGAGPKSGFSQKLPATAAETLALIKGVKF